MAMDGTYFESNGNLVLAFDGKLTPQNGGAQPPFQPTISPPASLFSSPASAVTFVLTDYLLDTAAWASVTINNGYIRTITNSQLPPSIPSALSLTTSNLLFLTAVDGIYQYPNRNMSVTLSVVNVTADFNAGGTTVSIDLETDFAILNATGTTTLPAFKILTNYVFVETVQPPTIVNNNLVLNASIGQWKGVVLGGSNVIPGKSIIDLKQFQDAISDIIPFIGTQVLPQITIPLPACTLDETFSFSASLPFLILQHLQSPPQLFKMVLVTQHSALRLPTHSHSTFRALVPQRPAHSAPPAATTATTTLVAAQSPMLFAVATDRAALQVADVLETCASSPAPKARPRTPCRFICSRFIVECTI